MNENDSGAINLMLKVNTQLLFHLRKVMDSLSPEQKEKLKVELKHLEVFMCNAKNTFQGKVPKVIDYDYYIINNEDTIEKEN